MKKYLAILLVLLLAPSVWAEKKTKFKKTQEVSFDGSDVDGVTRNPDGAYLAQKKGVKFLPLYKVEKKFDKEIKKSVDHLR